MNLQSPFVLTVALLFSSLPALSLFVGKGFHFSATPLLTSFPKKEPPLPEISFPTPIQTPLFPAEKAKAQLLFYSDVPRPTAQAQEALVQVHFLEGKEYKSLQSKRIGLQWSRSNTLEPALSEELFWLEVERLGKQKLIASIFYLTPDGKVHCGARWEPTMQEPPFRSSKEFAEASPFKELASSSFGTDLLAEKYGANTPLYRLEIGSSGKGGSYLLSPGDWLVFKDKQWQPGSLLETPTNCPVAQVKKRSGDQLEMEGWEGDSYVRFQLSSSSLPHFKVSGEELLTQLRVRSEKQISCMLDKQCLVLRAGDWVVKTDQRWKIIRKAEEKELLLQGKMKGDLLVLDRIDAKGLTKRIAGHYFSANHLQAAPIEKSVNSTRRR